MKSESSNISYSKSAIISELSPAVNARILKDVSRKLDLLVWRHITLEFPTKG
jgi:hypothetical protein